MSYFTAFSGRSRRMALSLGVASTAVLILLLLLYSQAQAVRIGSGAFNCGTFIDAVHNVPEGKRLVPMVPPRDSDSAIITKSVAIIGGWTRLNASNCPPENQNGDNNVIITGTQGMLDAGFDYVAPTTRSELNNSGISIVFLDLTGKNVLIEHMSWSGNNANTALEGAGMRAEVKAGSTLHFNNDLFQFDETSTANESVGGGLYLYLNDHATVTMEDSVFDQNFGGRGGGIYAEVRQNSHLLIERTTFSSNRGRDGGGLYLYVDSTSSVTLRDLTFSQNGNSIFNGGGAGLFMVVEAGGRVTIQDSTFDSNIAGEKGGGIYAQLNGGYLSIGRSSFTNNEADLLGSALYVENNSTADATVIQYGNSYAGNGPATPIGTVANNTGLIQMRQLDPLIYLPLTSNNYSDTAPRARITGITRQPDYSYSIAFETDNFTPQLPGTHLHFFFNTVSPTEAGSPGAGPWKIYGGASPFTGYSFVEKPDGLEGATQMCVLVANSNHTVIPNSGNCYDLPEA